VDPTKDDTPLPCINNDNKAAFVCIGVYRALPTKFQRRYSFTFLSSLPHLHEHLGFFFSLLQETFSHLQQTPARSVQVIIIITMTNLILIPAGDGTPVTFSTIWSAEHIDSVFQCLAPKCTEEKRNFVIVPTQIYEDMDVGAKTALANLFMLVTMLWSS
jgi:hypothetical protein